MEIFKQHLTARIMSYLYENINHEHKCTTKEISQWFDKNYFYILSCISELDKHDFITRTKHGRYTLIGLTQPGKLVARHIYAFENYIEGFI